MKAVIYNNMCSKSGVADSPPKAGAMPIIIFVDDKWRASKMGDQFDGVEDLPLREAEDIPSDAELDLCKVDLEMLLVRGGLPKTFPNKVEAVKTLKLNWAKVMQNSSGTEVSSMKGPSRTALLRECWALDIDKVLHLDGEGFPVKGKDGKDRMFDISNKAVNNTDLTRAIMARKAETTDAY